MCSILPLSAPGIYKHAYIRTANHFIKPLPPQGYLDTKSVHLKKHRQAPEGCAKIAIQKRQHPNIETNQLSRLNVISQQLQRVIGSDPSTTRGRTGSKAIAPFLLGDLTLIDNQLFNWFITLSNLYFRPAPSCNS